MEPPVLKVNDLLTKEQLEQELSQKQNNKTASTDDKIVPTQNETGAPQNEDAPPQSSELQNTVQ